MIDAIVGCGVAFAVGVFAGIVAAYLARWKEFDDLNNTIRVLRKGLKDENEQKHEQLNARIVWQDRAKSRMDELDDMVKILEEHENEICRLRDRVSRYVVYCGDRIECLRAGKNPVAEDTDT